MSRLPQISDADASAEATALFSAIKAKVGMVPNLYRVAAHQPAALKGLLGLGDALSGGGFDARTREAVALALAGANDCSYCASAHAAISAGLKVPEAAVDDHLEGRSHDPRTAAILALALEIVENRGDVSDQSIEKARTAGLSNADLVETVSHVAVNVFTNYLNNLARTDIDFPLRRARAA